MYSATKPFYVFDTRTRWLYIATVFAFLLALVVYENLVVYPLAPGSASDAITSLLFPIVLLAYCIWRYIKVVRIEFYEQFVRVVGKGGSANIDASYTDLEIGPLAKSGRSWYYSFRISLKARSDQKGWNVENSKLSGTSKTLYMSVQEHAANVRTAQLPPSGPLSIPGSSPPSRIKQPWLIVGVVGLLSLASFIFVSGALSGGLFLLGIILLFISRTLRARQIRSETSH
jgi:hypothetical protein